MSKKLKIENFGPIKGGYTENGGFIPISKVTIFCGSQGVGKSCIAKLCSTFSWLEKALVRGDFTSKYLTQYNRFVNVFCAFQNLRSYFTADTYLHYIGTAFDFVYDKGKLTVHPLEISDYNRPQIIYIPAERNLLGVIEEAENVKGIPQALASMLEVYNSACRNLKSDISLPINRVKFHYDALNRLAWIQSDGYKVRLNEASSGMQSLTPMYVVLDYLYRSVTENDDSQKSSKSLKEKESIQKRINEILMDDTLSPNTRKLLIEQVADTSNKNLFCVVEEPEQNLFPSSQRNVLNSLLSFVSEKDSQLVMTTHSPYIINYMSLAIKACNIGKRQMNNEQKSRLVSIVPEKAWTDGQQVALYEINEDGRIERLETYDDMPSDNNFLNKYLEETNVLFSYLLELEDELL